MAEDEKTDDPSETTDRNDAIDPGRDEGAVDLDLPFDDPAWGYRWR